ncbi:MAG: class A beta-lactamase-related serine hydrolase [Candidatus Pacebacteria bacterium]|jgi:beta-lactamase class A|nr:class A beta-lactamase-related serine hydrolase [Candidatus Paceibacterota bacterium]
MSFLWQNNIMGRLVSPVALACLAFGLLLGGGVVAWWNHSADSISGNSYPLLDPSAIYVGKHDLLVRFQPLRQSLLDQYTEHPDFHVGLYFEYLPTGANIVVNNDRAMWPASLIKIPVAMAALKKVERGEWKLTNELVILDEDKDASFGSLYEQPTGTTMTIEALLRATLIDSDNTAHFVLLRNLSANELEDAFFHLGLEEVLEKLKSNPTADAEDNRMTAKTYSVFFRSLYNATYLSAPYAELFLTFLLESGNEYARNGLPPDTTFAHKTGVRLEEGVWADSGIVYLNRRPYILTIMLEQREGIQTSTEEEVQKLFSDISNEVYTYVSSL